MTGEGLLPDELSGDELRKLRLDPTAWRAGLDHLLRAAGVPGSTYTPFTDGSAVVVDVDGRLVAKLYPPGDRLQQRKEVAALALAHGRLPVPTPDVVAAGDLGGWSWLVMTKLRGRSLTSTWDRLDADDRVRLLFELGRLTTALHALRPGSDSPLALDWTGFVAEQRATATERQRRGGLGEPWLGQVDSFLATLDEPGRPPGQPALLHTELMRQHVLVEERAGRPELSGLFDFADAMAGDPEYELASVGLFVSCGEPRLLRAFLDGYGRGPAARGPALSRRLLGWALLHRYSRLAWYLSLMPPEPGCTRLEALAERWFGHV